MTINQAAGVPWLLANGPVALGSRSGTVGGPSGNPRKMEVQSWEISISWMKMEHIGESLNYFGNFPA